MRNRPATARILVASDNSDDAQQIARQLTKTFKSVRVSTDGNRAVQDFDETKPDVLVLAFDTLDKAQRYYLGLYRHGGEALQQPHRTVILCDRDEVQSVYELCREEYFDDYVLYWPHSHDGSRLAMSVWNAARDTQQQQASQAPDTGALLVHARRIETLGQMLESQIAEGECHATAASDSLAQAKCAVESAIDRFAERLTHEDAASWVQVNDERALAREAEDVKQRQTAQITETQQKTASALGEWSRSLRRQVGDSMSGLRSLSLQVQSIRPRVMIVDDDRFIRQLITTLLAEGGYEFSVAADATAALHQLRRTRPDAMLIDIGLPDLDGVSLMKKLRATAQFASTPIVAMTADARRETILRSLEAGASSFVVKPFTAIALKDHLDKVLEAAALRPTS